MLTIDTALTLYTDQITKDNNIDTEKIIRQLSPGDVKEFLESAEAVRLICAFQCGKKFDEFFDELDRYKNEVCNLPKAADFRGKGGAEAEKQIDNIFREEFGDE